MIITFVVVLSIENKKYRRSMLWVMLGIWVAALIYLLFLYRIQGRRNSGFTFELFHMYRKANSTGWEATQALRQILFNILLYMPLGCILAALMKEMRFSFLVGICISIMTELLQSLTRLGWADVDDVVTNSFGLLIGIGLFKIIRSVIYAIRTKNGELC